MKKKITSIILGAAALIFMSFTLNTDDDQVHYTIIQHEGLSVTVHDTIVNVESGYTIQDYAEELGLSLENLEVFDVSDGETEFVNSDTDIWFFNTSEDGSTNSTIEINIEDANGEIGTFELDETTEEFIDEEGMEGEKVIIKTIIISGDEDSEYAPEEGSEDISEWIEEIEMEGGDIEIIEMGMDVRVEKMIDEDGNEVTQMWVNGEEVDPETFENDFQFNAGEGMETIIIENGSGTCNHSFTIGIISPVSEDGDKSSLVNSSNINGVTFNPKSNDEFQLTFTSDKKNKTEIILYDIHGKVVFSENLGDFSGEYNNTISLNGLSTGTYVLNILQNGERVVKKIIKQ